MIIHILYHWVYQDIWCPVWPNWAADFIIGIGLYIWGKRELLKLHIKLDKNHAELKTYVDEVVKELLKDLAIVEPPKK